MKRLAVAGIIVVVLVVGLWLIAVPRSLISGLITGSFRGSPVNVSVVDLEKGLFYNVHIGHIVLEQGGNTLLSVDDVSGRLSLRSLLKFRPAVTFRGDAAGGTIRGRLNFRGGGSVDIVVKGAHIEDMPFLSRTGIRGKGEVSGEYRGKEGAGKLKFTIKNAELKAYSLGGAPLPLNMFHSARGAMNVSGRTLRITSFAMEGKAIYARISGNVTGRMVDLTMEIMPDASLEQSDPMFSLIRRYEVSPGYYRIPFRGENPL